MVYYLESIGVLERDERHEEHSSNRKECCIPGCTIAALYPICYGLFIWNIITHGMKIHRYMFIRHIHFQWPLHCHWNSNNWLKSVIESLSLKFNEIGMECYWHCFYASLYKSPWEYKSTSMSNMICVQGPHCWWMSMSFFIMPFTHLMTAMMSAAIVLMLVCWRMSSSSFLILFHTSNDKCWLQYNDDVDFGTWSLTHAACFLK